MSTPHTDGVQKPCQSEPIVSPKGDPEYDKIRDGGIRTLSLNHGTKRAAPESPQSAGGRRKKPEQKISDSNSFNDGFLLGARTTLTLKNKNSP